MAYKLRYYKEIEHADGKVIRLEIHKKDSTAGAVMIGAVVQGLSLQIQGQQGDIDTPIVKTSLSMTFVDANDINNGRKNGFWEEFYTPDSVLWKVIVKAKDSQGAEFRTIWGGYVTPDSFTEDLVYRGSVNIIARDNIGHMQDFPFDAEGDADGMISLYNLVSSAWAKIDSPMALDWRGEEDSILWMNTSEWIPAYDTLMNVSAFEDMNWYQALEKALYSYGVVMRYAGNNRVVVCPLRSMPDYGREAGNIGHLVPQFITGATRELVPAVKRIEESVDYDMVHSLPIPHLKAQDFDGSTNSYRCKIEGVDMGYGSFGTAEHDAPVWPIINGDKGWSNIPSSTLYFSPFAYELGYFSQRRDLGEELLRYTYIAANNVDNRLVTFKKSITCSDFTIRMRFGQPWGLTRQGQLEQQSVFNLWRIYYTIMIDQNGVQEYYDTDRGWRPTYRQLSVVYDPKQENFDFEAFVAVGEHTGKADIYFIISKIEYAQTSLASIHQTGLYAQVQELSFNSPESASLLEKNTVNTNYKAENNVVISRDPEFGPAYNSVALPGFIKNGIFYREGGVIVPAKKWAFGRAGDQQMAVYNHLQLLAYYAKPNNLISGTIVNGNVTRVACIYDWHGAEHMLISGTYNLLNGHIESAVLREFARYEDMWSDMAGADMPDTEQESRSNMEGGGASGGGASATYANTTDVNVGGGGGGTGASYLNDLLDVDTDGVVAQSVLYFNGTSWVDMSLATLLNPYIKAEALAPVKAWFDKLGMLIVEEDGNVVVKTNLVIEGDMASAGAGENPGGGGSVIGGIIVNGMPYTDDDGDGFITLPDYPKKLSALENDLNLGSFAYKNALAVSDIPDLSGKYLPLSGGTIESTSGYMLTLNRTSAQATLIAFQNQGVLKGFLGINTDGTPLYLNSNAISYTLLHSGNYSNYALPLSGGVVDGTLMNPLTIKTSAAEVGIPMFVNNSAKMWVGWNSSYGAYIYSSASSKYLGIKDDGTPHYNGNTLIHSGNANKADVPWTASNILFPTGTSATWNIHSTNAYKGITVLNAVQAKPEGAPDHYAVGLSVSGYYGFTLASLGGGDVLLYRRKNDSDWKTIAFTDSDITGNAATATRSRYIETLGSTGEYWYGDSYKLYAQWHNSIICDWKSTDDANNQYKVRVDIAKKLDTARTIWGQSFDGTGDVSGGIRNALYLRFTDGDNNGIYRGSSYSNNLTNTDIAYKATSHSFYDGGGILRVFLNSSGNVTIGASDLASASYKFYVDGNSYTNGNARSYTARSNQFNTGDSVGLYAGSSYSSALTAADIALVGTKAYFNGNVLIGTTTNSGYKLDVAGTGRFTGKVSASGGIDIPNGQQLAFLDASGNRHTIAWDSASNGILIDGNLIVLGELATGLPMQEIPSIPEVGV